MSMSSPEQLIDEKVPSYPFFIFTTHLYESRFKKSGEFDRLRRELLAQFQQSERNAGLQSRVYEIARERLESDHQLTNLSHEAMYRELMGEIDRYPILERAVADAPLLSDGSFAENIQSSLEQILNRDKTAEIGNEGRDAA